MEREEVAERQRVEAERQRVQAERLAAIHNQTQQYIANTRPTERDLLPANIARLHNAGLHSVPQIPPHTLETAMLVDEVIHQYDGVIEYIPIVNNRGYKEMLIHGSPQPTPPPIPFYLRLIQRSHVENIQRLIAQIEPYRQFLCDTLSICPFLADLLGFAYAYKRKHPDEIVRLPVLSSLELAFPNIGLSENAIQYRHASVRLSAILSMDSLPLFAENLPGMEHEISIKLFSPLSYIYEYDLTKVHIKVDSIGVSVVPHRPWTRPMGW
jgi:hypothetical protein